ncbi:MAG: metallophosphoesterase [Thermaceae bacterium]|nr:metallophosphoesterase [Thermaceae bacterium]
MLTRRRFLALAGVAGLGLVGGAGAVVAQSYPFRINRQQRPLSGLERPLRMVQLSDLHYGPFIHAASVARWVDAALQQAPDVIVITGDLVDAGSRIRWRASANNPLTPDLDLLIAELGRLQAPLGVYSIWGNHDNWAPSAKRYLQERLPEVGIRILNNQGQLLRPDFYLGGVDDFWDGHADVFAALGNYKPGPACVMLAHNPDYLDFFFRRPVDLGICGHTHGGQVFLPHYGAPWTPSWYGATYLGGWYPPGQSPTLPPVLGFVSKGLGMTAVPLRLNAPAEVVVLDLQPLAR